MKTQIKNKTLYDKVMRTAKRYTALAYKAYSQGKRREGNKYDRLADKVYNDNFFKMFKVTY